MTRRTLLLFLPLEIPLLAKDKRKSRGDGSGLNVRVDIFIGSDRRVIREWIRRQPTSSLPPGLAKRESLPPGLQKQLAKKGKLPPGLEKRLTPFPEDLSRRLPPLQEGLERVFLHGRAVIMNRNTQVVLDVFLP
jgi:hypothetical protein